MDSADATRTFAASAGTPYAAEAAAEIYRAGGNAADAAVAAAAAVSVTEPLLSSIGGGGFALVRDPSGDAELIDYYDAMPGKGLPASAFGAGGNPQTVVLKYGAGVNSTVGGASVAVPGALRGGEALLQRHGRLALAQILAPAVRLARQGFRVCKTSAMWFQVAQEVLALTEETRASFFDGDRVYLEGELGRRISSYILKMGGIITERDLAEYEAVIRKPLSVAYGPGTVYTNGAPSAGGPTLAQMLRIVSGYDLAALPEPDYARVMAGAMKHALHDREIAYVDGAENEIVAQRLTSEEYARTQRSRIFGSPHTTHLSCVDDEGYVVSITATMGYGSGLVIPGTGIPVNNTLGEPELNPKGFHSLAPGERLISSMSPAIVTSEEGGLIALGSPGASRIPTAILQTLVNVLDFGMPLESAVLAPRFHAEGDLLAYETGARTGGLEGYGQVLVYEEPSMYFGGVNAVRRTPEGPFEAAADPRRSGGVSFV